ncbi:hypothetical protein [Streptomyces sp. 3N207]|uniref:hypothetical protein n=1 Tax=Streptomyces sp. 3N207 TaxID=3457417 RepID=UPI003FD493A2
MSELVRVDLPSRGFGFTLRQPSLWLRPDYVQFLGDGQRVWLFREVSQLRDFLGSDAATALDWRELVQADGVRGENHDPIDLTAIPWSVRESHLGPP